MSIMWVESREWMKLGGKAFFCFTVSGFWLLLLEFFTLKFCMLQVNCRGRER